MTFRELGLIAPILNALTEQGYETPSPIQRKAIPPALQGRDVLGCAQTAGELAKISRNWKGEFVIGISKYDVQKIETQGDL